MPCLRATLALLALASWGCAGGRVQGGATDDVTASPDATDDVTATEPLDDAPSVFDVTALDGALDTAFTEVPRDASAFDRAFDDAPRELSVIDRATNDLPFVDRSEPPAPDIAPNDTAPPWDVRADACTGTLCGGLCVDTRSDARHCGGCNRACVTPPRVREGAVRCLASTCGRLRTGLRRVRRRRRQRLRGRPAQRRHLRELHGLLRRTDPRVRVPRRHVGL
jgi:hypothetical protein